MATPETINIDVYPWAAPTAEQRAQFDALSPEEKRKMIRQVIADGFNSGTCERDDDTWMWQNAPPVGKEVW